MGRKDLNIKDMNNLVLECNYRWTQKKINELEKKPPQNQWELMDMKKNTLVNILMEMEKKWGEHFSSLKNRSKYLDDNERRSIHELQKRMKFSQC